MANIGVQRTSFTLDVLGRFVCNAESEAVAATERADARPFDVIVIGGGSFGPILAENVFFDDVTHSRRVLVLDAGPMVLPEHVQNLPVLGDVESLVRQVPWQSDEKLAFAGLRVMLGGRSAFFGGWSPQPLDDDRRTEMPRNRWPDSVVQELRDTYFAEAAAQLAVDETNDFIFGALHDVLRQRLGAGIDRGESPAPSHSTSWSYASRSRRGRRRLTVGCCGSRPRWRCRASRRAPGSSRSTSSAPCR